MRHKKCVLGTFRNVDGVRENFAAPEQDILEGLMQNEKNILKYSSKISIQGTLRKPKIRRS